MRLADKKRKMVWQNHHFLLVGVVGLVLMASLMFSRSLRSRVPNPTKCHGVGRIIVEGQLQGPLASEYITMDELKGSIVLLHFWGLWCPPCLRELPLIASLRSEFRQWTDVRILNVVCGLPGTTPLSREDLRKRAEKFLTSRGIDLPVYTDRSHTMRRNVAMTLGKGMHLGTYPTTLLLDRQGVIRAVWIGYHADNKSQMKAQISRLLNPVEGNVGKLPAKVQVYDL